MQSTSQNIIIDRVFGPESKKNIDFFGPESKKKSIFWRRVGFFSPPHSKKINSHDTIRSVVRDQAYPPPLFFLAVKVLVGRELRKIRGTKNEVRGCPDKKNEFGLFRPTFTPTFKKINSHDTIRSVVRDLTYPFLPVKVLIGCGLRKISGAQKTVIFAKKKVGFFSIL